LVSREVELKLLPSILHCMFYLLMLYVTFMHFYLLMEIIEMCFQFPILVVNRHSVIFSSLVTFRVIHST